MILAGKISPVSWPARARAGTRWPILGLLALVCAFVAGHAAEVIPPAPRDHFNDHAGVVRRETATQLNSQLAQFERDTSNQIVVAIFPRLQSASSVEDYTVRVAQSWGVGQRERRNGAVLFVFQESRDIRIVTGYGLEGALPDALCKQIIENEIVPRFRAGDFDGGVKAGVEAMMAAARGEYRGTGRTVGNAAQSWSGGAAGGVIFLIMVFLIITMMRRSRRDVVYGRRGRHVMWGGGPPWGGGGGWGGGSSGGGGTFSGGGGSFGGGGAGGRW
ncbi:MAG: TPM domain-containing protein [Opitutaceae bacterium]|nr:TPM domain-containing protein [Opitutaceae bacterium]